MTAYNTLEKCIIKISVSTEHRRLNRREWWSFLTSSKSCSIMNTNYFFFPLIEVEKKGRNNKLRSRSRPHLHATLRCGMVVHCVLYVKCQVVVSYLGESNNVTTPLRWLSPTTWASADEHFFFIPSHNDQLNNRPIRIQRFSENLF